MKKFLAITIAAAFLFAGSASIVGAQQSATDLNGIKISGGVYLSFLGSYLSSQDKAKNLYPASVSRERGQGLFTLFLDKDFSNGGAAHMKIKGGNSTGGALEIGAFRSALDDNTGGDEKIYVEQAWYQHPFLDGALKVKIGKTNDIGSANDVADSVSAFFLGEPTYAGASGADVAAYGVIVDYDAMPILAVQYGYMTREHQTEDGNFSHPLQLISFNLHGDVPGLGMVTDNFRIGYWQSLSGAEFADYRVDTEYQYSAHRDEYRWDENDVRYIQRGGKANPQGIFLSLDRELFETVGLFFRFGLRLDKTVGQTGEAGQSWQAGTKIKGSLWSRSKDSLFIGIGQATYQSDVLGIGNKVITNENFDNDDNWVGSTYEKVKPETHFEVNYKFSLADQVTLVAYGVYVCDIFRDEFEGKYEYPDRSEETNWNPASITNYGYGGGLALQISF